jgi:hypothetical protein
MCREVTSKFIFSLFIMDFKSSLKRIRWAGHVARMGGRGTLIDYWWESQKERDH